MQHSRRRWLFDLLGINLTVVSVTEKLISALGGAIGIAAVVLISQALLPNATGTPLLIASMGASAVLLFAVPHGPLSQPWPFIAGHLLSAVIGVSCAQWLGTQWWSAAIAVGLSIGVMHLLRCIHPPGGATALTAVIGGDAIHALGYQFVLLPVGLNVLVLLIIAFAFNGLFRWRRYPAALIPRPPVPVVNTHSHYQPPIIEHAHLVAALSQIDSYIDISEQDLLRIYELATQQVALSHRIAPPIIAVGHYYSNGRFGSDWEVRQVLRIQIDDMTQTQYVSFRRVTGHRRRSDGRLELIDFQRWAAHEVIRDENSWRPVDDECVETNNQ
ncbi:HPP family protein [Thiospirillum jenense]|uniref:HPP family protein n=1 Tax=Thiospirillum jenense TaxID=1653858 RepID=A0A839H980_9GAMM|nr:HPP family protein [Thiospirillum jenense]MBB1125883.1 HPP family protein [Thiospirillum jenense]